MSSSSLNISEVLDKIEELQSVFQLGQQTMPFLEELFHFIEDIEPLLDEINASIRESTHKMPHAKSKLQSVTEATELATTEILDLVDAALHELKMLTSTLQKTESSIASIQAADERLIKLLREELPEHQHELLQKVQTIHDERQALLQQCAGASDEELQAVKTIRQKMTQIMMALQVQDITSQQIAAVNHIIETLRDRMTRLVEHPSITAEGGDNTPLESDGSFDVDAQFNPTGDHQSRTDELIESLQQNGAASDDSGNEVATQDDIDELFG
jgi:chemotaxis regulatin CheY-phosphate phosphatase CheZ